MADSKSSPYSASGNRPDQAFTQCLSQEQVITLVLPLSQIASVHWIHNLGMPATKWNILAH